MSIYGQELVESLEKEIASYREAISRRIDHINACDFDWDDCFISQRCEERGISNAENKIALIKDGGCAWFLEYATLDGQLVDATWCRTKFGHSLRVRMPNGQVVWTTASTAKGLAKKGIKKVECKRPAWYKFSSGGSGMWGVYSGNYVLFPSDVNYANGEEAGDEPIEMRDVEEVAR